MPLTAVSLPFRAVIFPGSVSRRFLRNTTTASATSGVPRGSAGGLTGECRPRRQVAHYRNCVRVGSPAVSLLIRAAISHNGPQIATTIKCIYRSRDAVPGAAGTPTSSVVIKRRGPDGDLTQLRSCTLPNWVWPPCVLRQFLCVFSIQRALRREVTTKWDKT